MKIRALGRLGLAAVLAASISTSAHATYWNVFNIEGDTTLPAGIATYASLNDMLNDTNRLSAAFPTGGGVGQNVIDSGSNGKTYWNLFNIEGESSLTAGFATYSTLNDMLNDTNRQGVFYPTGGGVGPNVVGAGFDGHTYWNLFNIEGESSLTAGFATYGTLNDMLNDTNRLGVFYPTGGGVGQNVVGSGSDGKTYWNLFNIEGEASLTAGYVTYGTLNDMLNDTNRLGVFYPTGGGVGQNVVGTGFDGFAAVGPNGGGAGVPEPAAWATMIMGFTAAGAMLRRRRLALARIATL